MIGIAGRSEWLACPVGCSRVGLSGKAGAGAPGSRELPDRATGHLFPRGRASLLVDLVAASAPWWPVVVLPPRDRFLKGE